MPVKIGQFILDIAAKAGVNIDTTSPELIDILASGVEIPESVSNAFNSAKILTPEAARNNKELKFHYFSQAMNGIDAEIESILDQYEFPEDARTEIKSVNSTFGKLPILAQKMKDLHEKRDSATGSDKTALTKQINDLQAEMANKLREKDEAIAAEKNNASSRITNMILRNKIASRKLDTSKFDSDMMQDIALNLLNKELQTKGAKIINHNDELRLRRVDDEQLEFYENNNRVTIDSFIDQLLANNKLLAVTDQPPAPGNNGTQHYNPPANPSGNQPRPLNGMKSSLEQALADYNQGSARG